MRSTILLGPCTFQEPWAEAYYQRKRQDGKTHSMAVRALSRKPTWWCPMRCVLGARLERQRRRWAEAEAALEVALALCRSMRYHYAEVKALSEYGYLRLQQGLARQAREHFEAALVTWARLGERLYAQQIEAELAILKQAETFSWLATFHP